jgi:hypothetical protein
MADEVFYSEGKLLSGRGASVPRTALSGGDEIFFTEITSNFTSSSASYIDVTGLTSGEITVPEGPFIVEAYTPLVVPTSGVQAAVQIVNGSTVMISDAFRAAAANDGVGLYLRQRFPSSMHSPAPGSLQTYRVQFKSSTTATAISIFVDFGGRVNPAYIRGVRT